MKEQLALTERLDENGFSMGGNMEIHPINGRKKTIALKRTEFHFLSSHFLSNGLLRGCFIHLPEMKNEKFHVSLKQIETLNSTHSKRKRFYLEVESGNPFKLNGSYHNSSFIEFGDKLEIGFNTIYFREDREVILDPAVRFISENQRLINSSLPLLLTGETGVGKSSLARKVHESTGRPGHFVQLNMSSFSSQLLESELFGHVKGAFTGAHQDKNGAFKKANYGTLFIDEIDSLPLDIQTKLLVFLDDQVITPVGANQRIQLDVKLIFASGRKLIEVVQENSMRRDFYFRLTSGVSYKLESLRNCPELITIFCEQYAVDQGLQISAKLVDFYKSLPWPGNYRQLQGHLDRKRILSQSLRLDFDSEDETLIEQSSELSSIATPDGSPSLKEVKLAYAQKIFCEAERNYTKAATILGVSTKCLKSLVG